MFFIYFRGYPIPKLEGAKSEGKGSYKLLFFRILKIKKGEFRDVFYKIFTG